MSSLQHPRLVDLDFQSWEREGMKYLRLHNRAGLSGYCLDIPARTAPILRLFDGNHSLEEIRREVLAELDGTVPANFLDDLLSKLDEIYLLDTPRHRARKSEVKEEYKNAKVRFPSHAGGAYAAEPAQLRKQIQEMFADSRGPGMPSTSESKGAVHSPVRGILSPHIDFHRGGPSFAWGFKELAERTTATTFVILGTSHYSCERFVLSRKDYQTPLGLAKTDQAFVDRLAGHCGSQLFEDEYASKSEHSIEFQVLFLQYLFEGKRDFRIVPILVGSFHDAIERGMEPSALPDVRRLIEGLELATGKSKEGVCFICSGDLAHIGMKFGDPWTIDASRSRWCRAEDDALLKVIETGNPRNLFQSMVRNQDERRICGFPPAYVMLHAMGETKGKRLCYDQFVDPRGYEIVSFASMAFH